MKTYFRLKIKYNREWIQQIHTYIGIKAAIEAAERVMEIRDKNHKEIKIIKITEQEIIFKGNENIGTLMEEKKV